MCGAKRSEAKPPTIRLRRLKNFPRGPPGRAQKQNSGFHKDLIQGVFLSFSPGHLPKKPSPFTQFFQIFIFHQSFHCFALLLAAAYFSEIRTRYFFSSKIPQKFKPSPSTEKKPSPFILNLFFSFLFYSIFLCIHTFKFETNETTFTPISDQHTTSNCNIYYCRHPRPRAQF